MLNIVQSDAGAKTPQIASGEVETIRTRSAVVLRRLARWQLGLMIISLSWRLRVVLVERNYPPLYQDFTDLLIHLPDLLLVGLLLLWGIGLWLQPRRLRTGPAWMWLPLLGLTAAAMLSVVGAVDPVLSAYSSIQLLSLLGLYLYLVNEDISLESLIWPVSILLGLQSMIGAAQVWRQHDLGLNWLGERSLNPQAGDATVWAEGGLLSLRAYGLTDHPNILAINLALGMVLLVAWMMTRASRSVTGYLPAGLVFSWSAVVLLLTFSRTAWISLVGGGLSVVVLARGSLWVPWLRNLVVTAGMALLIMSPFLWRSLPFLSMGTTAEMMSARVTERLYKQAEDQSLNNITNRLFAANALNGVGLGGLPQAIKRGTTDFLYDFQPSRIVLLTAAAETGILGASSYLWLQLIPWAVIWFNRRRLAVAPALIGLSAGLMAMALFGMQDAFGWSHSSGRSWQWLLWGLWAAAYGRVFRSRAELPYA